MFEISEHTWQIAKKSQLKLSEGLAPGIPHIHYLSRYHEMKTSEGLKPMGIPGLTHNFIAINDELYAIANEADSPLLGRGTFGQVFLGQNSQGKTCAIKKESARKHHPYEVEALSKMGHLQGQAHIDDEVFTIMDVFPGTSLMRLHEKGKTPDPWQAAAQELGYNVQNLAQVKQDLMGYDDFDDSFSYDLICRTMSRNSANFTQNDLEKLKAKAGNIQNNNTYSPHERTSFAYAAAQEIKRAFDAGILHRDIKGDNFVGRLEHEHHARVALIDFGGAIDIGRATHDESAVGSPTYMAPEVLRALPADFIRKTGRKESIQPGAAQFSQASDVFSFAIMCDIDLGLDADAGFGILKLARAIEPSDRPSIDEILCLLHADLALQSDNRSEQEQALSDVKALKLSPCITAQFKSKVSQALIKATMAHIRDDTNKASPMAASNENDKENKGNHQP